MKAPTLSNLTNEELLAEAKNVKSNSIINAVLIGVFIGIIVYSIAKNSVGFFTLIPLFFVYKAFNKPNDNVELEKLLKERGLK